VCNLEDTIREILISKCLIETLEICGIMTEQKNNNLWTPEDEHEHFPCIVEWWAIESFFKTIENGEKWSLKSVFTQWFENKKNIGSRFIFNLINQTNNTVTECNIRIDGKKLDVKNNKLDVGFNESFIKGSYPTYRIYLVDTKSNIKIDIKYESISLPHWIGQDITNGFLPFGAGFYRYGFIPKNRISGYIEINNKKLKIDGMGYLEHVWGDLFYDNPFFNLIGFKKTIPLYLKLFRWWKENNKLKIPDSIFLSTENNPFGYDWAWAMFENGWSIFYGNILFWIMKGPAFGTLILTKDGQNYKEFVNLSFKYNKMQKSKNFDFVFPTEFEVFARDKEEELKILFKMKSDPIEFISTFPKSKYYLGLVICEAPGIVEGYYSDGKNKINIMGLAKIEPQRQVSILGHNILKIDIVKPPKGIGVSFDLNSNLLKKEIFAGIKLFPRPKINFKTKKI